MLPTENYQVAVLVKAIPPKGNHTPLKKDVLYQGENLVLEEVVGEEVSDLEDLEEEGDEI